MNHFYLIALIVATYSIQRVFGQLEFNCEKYQIDWTIQGLFIYFDIKVYTSDSIAAVGISESNQIGGSDILAFDTIGKTDGDYHVNDAGVLILPDTNVNSIGSLLEENENYKRVQIIRRLFTADSNDVEIKKNHTYHLIWFEITTDYFPSTINELTFGIHEVCFDCVGFTQQPITSTTCKSYASTITTARTTSPIPGDGQLEFNNGKYKISWEIIADELITFHIESETMGSFVAVGIATKDQIIGADILAIEVLGNSEIIVGDYHIGSNGLFIVPDPNQASGTLEEHSGEVIKVKITRRLSSSDPGDIGIKMNDIYDLIWFEIETETFPTSLSELNYGLHEVCFGSNDECKGFSVSTPFPTTTGPPDDGKFEFNDGKYRISWSLQPVFISFDIESQTNSTFVAVGISEAEQQSGIDIMVVELERYNQTTWLLIDPWDYHVDEDGNNIIADDLDFSATMIDVNDEWKKVRMTRRYATTDPNNDVNIIRGANYSLVWFEVNSTNSTFPNNLDSLVYGFHPVCFGNNEECGYF